MSQPTKPPIYKGEPLDAERGPGLGCFWIQVALLTFFLIFTPLTVTWGWDPTISGALLIFTLILLLFTGQTVIFLLRLVAADRRSRRAPLDPKARRTVGQMEDEDAARRGDEAASLDPDVPADDAADDLDETLGRGADAGPDAGLTDADVNEGAAAGVPSDEGFVDTPPGAGTDAEPREPTPSPGDRSTGAPRDG